MSSWDYISKRRRTTLVEFVREAETLAEALELFKRRGVKPPLDGSLEKLFSEAPEDRWGTVPKDTPVVESTESVTQESERESVKEAADEVEATPTPGYPRGKRQKKKKSAKS